MPTKTELQSDIRYFMLDGNTPFPGVFGASIDYDNGYDNTPCNHNFNDYDFGKEYSLELQCADDGIPLEALCSEVIDITPFIEFCLRNNIKTFGTYETSGKRYGRNVAEILREVEARNLIGKARSEMGELFDEILENNRSLEFWCEGESKKKEENKEQK